ncbi:hypothetical protein AYI68_g8124 [Smittium mucronatum]|uniref:Uncharacterized protein n=1 Tax=Smittium mucronatum TaxID=133383 RepID=A0A1R0GLT9_9FUNG|nr:hypothetical protein AYI68_g8124 [Smittium mucronatum]
MLHSRTRQPAATLLRRNHPQLQPIESKLAASREASRIFGGDAYIEGPSSDYSDGRIQNPAQEPNSHEIYLHKQKTLKLVIGPYVSKILGRSSTDVTNAAEKEKDIEGSTIAACKARNRGCTATDIVLLQSTVHNYEEDWRLPPCAGSEESQSECGGAEFQYGNPDFHLKNSQTKGLHHVQEYVDFGIPRRHVDPGRDQGYLDGDQHQGNDTESAAFQDQGYTQGSQKTPECWPNDIEMSIKLYRKCIVYVNSSASGEAYFMTNARAEESISLVYDIMDFRSNNNETRAPEPAILERQSKVM